MFKLCAFFLLLATLHIIIVSTASVQKRPDQSIDGDTEIRNLQDDKNLKIAINWHEGNKSSETSYFNKFKGRVLYVKKAATSIWSYFTMENAPALVAVAEQVVSIFGTLGTFFMSSNVSFGR